MQFVHACELSRPDPDAAERGISVYIVAKYPLPEVGAQYIERARTQLAPRGIALSHEARS